MSSRASSDEGEIRDQGSEKALKSLPQLDGAGVDRQDRTRSRYSNSTSPNDYNRSSRKSADRSRSPYRVPHGAKRHRDEDHYERQRNDSRRFKVHYEDRPSQHQRQQISYDDIDKGTAPTRALQYDDRDRHQEKRHRTRSRSRSPYRSVRENRGRKEYSSHNGHRREEANRSRDQSYSHNDSFNRGSRDQPTHRGRNPQNTDSSRQEAKYTQGHSQQSENGRRHVPDSEKYASHITGGVRFADERLRPNEVIDIQEEPELEPELTEAEQIEIRRKKREALRNKYKGAATPMLVQALHSNVSAPQTPSTFDNTRSRKSTTIPQSVLSNLVDLASPASSTASTPGVGTAPPSPSTFNVTDDQDLVNTHADAVITGEEDGPSAADYDPTMDMREDRNREIHHAEVTPAIYEQVKPSIEQDDLLATPAVALERRPVKQPKDEFDMFASDDDDDMFADSPVDKATDNITGQLQSRNEAVPVPEARELDIGMLDNWDDPEGYYKIILGELLNGRYHVQSNLGQGMFSGVVRATDVTTKKLVAIKLIRNNETMRKAGMKEIEILNRLKESDPEDKKHMIRLERHFEHKGHLCMVFENLSINLREVLKKFGRDVGINLKAVRAYAQQMFLGLSLMKKCNILHADLKPDNILVNDGRNLLKICDLGSASDATENEITPYLVSRFYRAPEIILGMRYDFAIDIWSIGCTLYEMYTGKILFTGRTNNQMLRAIMECRGPFTRKILNQAEFAHVHFDIDMKFKSMEQDKMTGRDTVKMLAFAKPVRDLRTRLLSASKGLSEVEMKELNLFTDLLDRCLALNPAKRLTPNEALKHPFLLRPIAMK